MNRVTTIADLRRARQEQPGPVGVVMTMGALHAGHEALIAAARADNASVVVTLFVNPLQFGPGEDLDRYPRPLEQDLETCRRAGADLVFTPQIGEMYPDGAPLVRVSAGHLGEVLEGAYRPGHFDGVLTVVAKLMHLTRPDRAYFGEKDAQQLLFVRRMVRDLDLPVEIVGVPIVREPDGLARSSRNAYLAPDERATARALSRALLAGARAGGSGAPAVRREARAVLDATPGIGVDYLALIDPRTLSEIDDAYAGPALLAVAARVGTTRLIDNTAVTVRATDEGT
jgi:pantoate--beta-alanine ligase